MSRSVKPIPSVARLDQRSASCTQGTALAVATCRQRSLGDVSRYAGVADNVALGINQPGRSSTHQDSIVF